MGTQEVEPLQPGDQLYEYRIDKVLGQGGFGITYLGVNVETGDKVVIKENIPGTHAFRRRGEKAFSWAEGAPESGAGSSRWARENFVREARNLAKLNHPNVVRVLNAYESDVTHTQYYVMPFVESVSLEQAMKRGLRPTHDWAHFMLCSLLQALQYIHTAGLLHRDIKPGNILVKADGRPVLIDFGSARAMEKDGKTRIVSEDYSPIEQMRGSGEGPWTDIYALGATLYQVLCGNCPARLMQRMDDPQSYAPLAADKSLVSRFGYPLLSGIDRALAFEPTDRYRSAAEWLDTMSEVPGFQCTEPVPLLLVAPAGRGGAKTVLMDTPTPDAQPETKRKKVKLLLLLGALPLLLAAAAGATLLLQKKPESQPAEPGTTKSQQTQLAKSGTTESQQTPSQQPQPTTTQGQQVRVIIRPNARLLTVDGTGDAPESEQPAPFSVFYVVGQEADRYLVTRRAGLAEEPVGSLRKGDVHVWNTNLVMLFNAKRSEQKEDFAGALTSDNRALFFDTYGNLKKFVLVKPSVRRSVAKRVEDCIADAKKNNAELNLGEIREQYGVIGVEPKRRGEYRLPLLEFPLDQKQLQYGQEDQIEESDNLGFTSNEQSNKPNPVETKTLLVKVAAMNAPHLTVNPLSLPPKPGSNSENPPSPPPAEEPRRDVVSMSDTSVDVQTKIEQASLVARGTAEEVSVNLPPLQPKLGSNSENPPSPLPVEEPQLDVVFVLDTSASMQPKIDQACNVMRVAAAEITEKLPQARYAIVGYRDWKASKMSGEGIDMKFMGRDSKENIEYVVHRYTLADREVGDGALSDSPLVLDSPMFTLEQFQEVLGAVRQTKVDSIDGSEDLLAGLEAALLLKGRPNAIRRIILIGDAPGRGLQEDESVPVGEEMIAVIKDGREVDTLSLVPTHWDYRAKGTSAKHSYDTLKKYLKGEMLDSKPVNLVGLYFYSKEPKDGRRLHGAAKYTKAFEAYQKLGFDQFSRLCNKVYEYNVENRQSSAQEGLAQEIAGDCSKELKEKAGTATWSSREWLPKLVRIRSKDAENDTERSSQGDDNATPPDWDAAAKDEFLRSMQPIAHFFVEQLGKDGISDAGSVRKMASAVELWMQETRYWENVDENVRPEIAKLMAQGIIRHLKESEGVVMDPQKEEEIGGVICSTLSYSMSVGIMNGIGLDAVMEARKKSKEDRERWLLEQKADEIHDVFAEAYVEWDASRINADNEAMDGVAWMPDKAEPNRNNLKACVVLSRKQVESLAEHVNAVRNELISGREENTTDALYRVAGLFCDVIVDPGQRSKNTGPIDINMLRERIKSLGYGMSVMNRVKEGISAGEQRSAVVKCLEVIANDLRHSAAYYWIKVRGEDDDYIIKPLNEL